MSLKIKKRKQKEKFFCQTEIVKLPKSGRVYHRRSNGQLVRVQPERPWRGKKERKKVLRERQIERAEAELKAKMERIKQMPPPTLEEVETQMKASAEFIKTNGN